MALGISFHKSVCQLAGSEAANLLLPTHIWSSILDLDWIITIHSDIIFNNTLLHNIMLWPFNADLAVWKHKRKEQKYFIRRKVCLWYLCIDDMTSPTLTAAFKSGVRWNALGSGAQRVQTVQRVVSPVSTSFSSSSSHLIELLSLRVPAITKTAVSDVVAFLTGRFLQSLSYTHKYWHSQIVGCQLQYLVPLCVWCMRDLPGRAWSLNYLTFLFVQTYCKLTLLSCL